MATKPGKARADYTEGSIIGSILKMGLPSMFGFLSQNIYSLVDTYWVSRLEEGEAAVAAITFYSGILWVFFSFNQLVGTGSVAVISRRYGEKKFDEAETAIKETLVLKLFFGFLFGIIGFFTVRWMLSMLGAEGDALTLGTSYGKIMFLGMGAMYATYSIFTAMRGAANPGMAMGLMIGSNLLNLALDPLLIFGYFGLPKLGVVGAAVASVGSFTLTLLVGLALFFADRTNVALHWRSRVPIRVHSMWRIMKIGIPAWAGSISHSGARLVITRLVAAFGTSVVAAYGVGNQITSFGVMVLVGVSLGLSSLIGHNLGSAKLARAKKTGDQSILLGVGIMILFSVITFFGSETIMKMFFEHPETVAIGRTMLRILSLAFPFWGAYVMIEGIHSGVGLNTPAMIANIIASWGLEVVPIIVFTGFLGFTEIAVWWILSISYAATTVGFYAYYRRGRWLTVQL